MNTFRSHQDSLLTRKVFSWHNLSAQVFFSVSAGSSHLQVIFFFKSSSSDLDHLSIWTIMEHHHWIWIISWSGSSLLNLDHHWLSSLDLDHHWCYLMILLIIGNSTKPTLFHAGCRPTHHVGLLPTLTSDLLVRKACPALTSDLLLRKACPTLTSDHVGTNPIIISESPSTHIH